MKRKEFIQLTCFLIISFILLIIGIFFMDGYYQPMVIGAAFGAGLPSGFRVIQYIYLHQPKNSKILQQKIVQEKIERTDERMIMIKQKASSYTFQIMIVILLGASFISALLQANWKVTGLLFLLCIVQAVVWYISYTLLNKKC